nr:uncharacterized protein LOC113729013 [Coffea arabica]
MAVQKNTGDLDFKDLEAFNKALLGKQLWRLLTKPNLLVSKVLKSKYFSQESILQCTLPKNASWIWQGLLGARGLLDEGLIRRIGNGRNTKIWDHKWLPETLTGKPSICRTSNCELKMVDKLICQQRWNRNVIFRNFNKEDAEKILCIPLSLSGRKDSFYWKPKVGGEYTVDSGYKILMEKGRSKRRYNQEGAGTSVSKGSQQMVQMWDTFWRLNIKHKIKHFIWKCIKRALPIREAMRKRTGVGDPICSTCGKAQETIEHMLLNCPHALEVWKSAPIQWDRANDQRGDFKRWWLRITEARTRQEGKDHIGLTANILWQVWKDRNKKEYENSVRLAPLRIVERAHKEWMEQGVEFKQGIERVQKKQSI